MQNERSGARKQRKRDEVLSPVDAARHTRGQELKRCVRAAVALRGIYTDTALGDEVGVGRGAVLGWWTGAHIEPDNMLRLAEVTGFSFDELSRYVYRDGPLPRLPEPSGPAGLREGAQRAEERPDDEEPGTPSPSPRRPPRGGGKGPD